MPNDSMMGDFSGLIEVEYTCGEQVYRSSLTPEQHTFFLGLQGKMPGPWHPSLFEGPNAMTLPEWLDWMKYGSGTSSE